MEIKLIKKLFELKKKSIILLRDEQAYNYKYADLSQIQDKIAPFLEELGLLIVHATQNGSVVTTIYDVDSESFISSSIELGKINTTREWTDNKGVTTTEITEQDPQAVGGIITYYRRYNLLQLLDLKTEDKDAAGSSPRAKAVQSEPVKKEEPRKPWINDTNIADLIKALSEGVVTATSGEDAVKLARGKYAVSKASEAKIIAEYSRVLL